MEKKEKLAGMVADTYLMLPNLLFLRLVGTLITIKAYLETKLTYIVS